MGAPGEGAPMFLSPMLDTLTRRALAGDAFIPERAAQRAAVVPLLAALLAGEELTAEERGAVVDEVLRGWRLR